MSAKPPVLMLVKRPADWGLDTLSDEFDIRSAVTSGIEAVVTGGGEGIDAATMDALPDLKLIAVCAVGYDAVDLPAAVTRGIAVTNTPDVLTDDVADLAIALALSVFRCVPQYDRYVRESRWATADPPPLTRRFGGSRIGIVGLGRIGAAIARRAEAFACEIAYHSRRARAEQPWRHERDLVALAGWADILMVAVPGGAATTCLIDAAVIEALGPTGVLVNVARGPVVDEAALVSALVAGRLGGAGLDVFTQEPNVPPLLLDLDTVVLQPHQGSATVETRRAMADLVRENLRAYFADRPLLTPVSV